MEILRPKFDTKRKVVFSIDDTIERPGYIVVTPHITDEQLAYSPYDTGFEKDLLDYLTENPDNYFCVNLSPFSNIYEWIFITLILKCKLKKFVKE